MITLKLPIQLNQEHKDFIKELQKEQSPMIRCAYKQAEYGCLEISVREELRNRFQESRLDSWFQQSAVKSGMGMFKADDKLGNSGRIFGSKKNFIKRLEGKISNEEWKDCRLLPLYVIGESPARGNRKFEISFDKVVFKPWKGIKLEIDIPPMNKNWSKLWKAAVEMAANKMLPITISLDQNFIYLCFEDHEVKKFVKSTPKAIKNRYAGIDMNPNYIGVSVFDDNKLVETKLFSLKELTGKNKNENKLSHETHEIGHAIGRWLKNLRVDKVFIEDLGFKPGDMKKGKNLNRLCKNQWKRSKLVASVGKYFPKLYEINAAYTSTIGNVLHPDLPDPVAASTAVAARGYELVIKKSKKFYPDLPTLKELEDRWKETEFPVYTSWKELHDFIKNAGLKYRVPIPEKEGFRIFQSRSSLVGVL